MRDWLSALVRWALDSGLPQRPDRWIQWFDEDETSEQRRRRAMRLLHGSAPHVTGSQGVVFETLPGVGEGIHHGWLPSNVVRLSYRMARTVQLVAAVYGYDDADSQLERHILLVMAMSLRLPEGRRTVLRLAKQRHVGDLASAIGFGNPRRLASRIGSHLIRRHHAIQAEAGGFAFAIEDAVHCLVLHATGLAAVVYFDQMDISSEDMARLSAESMAQAQLLLRLTMEMSKAVNDFEPEHVAFIQRLADFVGLPAVEREALLAPPEGVDWSAYCTSFVDAEQRRSVLEALVTMACLDEGEHPVELEYCRMAAARMGLSDYDVVELTELARRRLAEAASSIV